MKKREKRTKKLTSLVLLLFLTIVMLSTATYAWFTSNKTITVSTIDVNVAAKSGLQISADGYTWKTVITNSDLTNARTGRYSGAKNQIPAVLEPVSTAGEVITNSSNGTVGFLEMFTGVVEKYSGDASGDFALVSENVTESDGSTGNYIAFDVFLKAEVGAQLYLTSASGVTAKDATPDTGLKNAARVAFVVQGTPTPLASGENLSLVQSAVTTDFYLWEPNYDTHTVHGSTAAQQLYSILEGGNPIPLTGAAIIPYDGISAAFSTQIKLFNANATQNPLNFASITPDITTTAGYGAATTFLDAFPIQAGITKVRIYMWVEGQDVDCENNASGSDISFNVQLSLNDELVP